MLWLVLLWSLIVVLLVVAQWGTRALTRSAASWPWQEPTKVVDRVCGRLRSLGTWVAAAALLVALPVTFERIHTSNDELSEAMTTYLDGSTTIDEDRLADALGHELGREVSVEPVAESPAESDNSGRPVLEDYSATVDSLTGSARICITVESVRATIVTDGGETVPVRSARISGYWAQSTCS